MKVNEFKKKYKVNEESSEIERKKGGEIIITPALKAQIIELLHGKIEKKDIKGIGDDETIEIVLLNIVADNLDLDPLFEKYYSRKRINYEGYTFRPEAIEMLRSDCSQTDISERLGIPRKTFSGQIRKIREENANNELGQLLREHAERKMKKIDLTEQEKHRINCMLDQYIEKHPISEEGFDSKDPAQLRFDNLSRLLETVEQMLQEGATLKEISEKKIISESNYRKYKAEAKYLGIILDRRNKNLDSKGENTDNSNKNGKKDEGR